ncbi:MAG: AsmA family protein [Ghiorsea sp.]
MFKVLKYLTALVVFIILALLALPFFIDVNDYKPEISAAVYDATGRNVDIEHINLSVFPWVGVTLKNVRLQNAQGFKQPYMVSVKAIDVQLELVPLFNKDIEVKRFILDTPKIWLEQNLNHTNNWQDLVASKDEASNASPTPTSSSQPTQKNPVKKQVAPSNKTATTQPPIALNADLLQLHDGVVTWSDASTGEIKLSDIQLDIQDLQLEQPITIDLSAKLGNNPFNLHANVGPLRSLDSVNISTLPLLIQLKSQGFNLAPLSPWLPQLGPAQVEQVGDLSAGSVNVDISIEQHKNNIILSSGSLELQMKHKTNLSWKTDLKHQKTLNIQEVKLALNDTHVLNLSGKIKHIQKQPRYEFRLETAKLQRIWLNQFLPELQDLYLTHPEPWQSIKLGTLIAGDQDIVDIRDLRLELNDEPIQASGNIALGSAPDMQLRISANTLHLDPWIPQSKTVEENQEPANATTQVETPTVDTAVVVPQPVEPNLTFLKPWYVSLQLNAKSIHAMQLQLDNLRLTLSAEKGVVRLNPLSFEIADGHITENFTLYANQHPATWKESMKMSGVSVMPVLKAVADFDKLSGIAQLTTDLSGKGLLPKSITQSLNGNGHFVFEDGQFKGVDIAKEVRKLTKKSTAQANATDFAQMQGRFRVSKGVVSNNDLYMASPLFRLTGKGKLYLDPLQVDYHVRPRLINSLAGQGGSQVQQGIVIPLHIKGPFDNLDISIEMDKQSLLDSAAALNKATGNKVGGVAGQVLNQGFVKTREAQKKKAAAKLVAEKVAAKKRAQEKVAAEKARLKAQAKKKAEDALKERFKSLF